MEYYNNILCISGPDLIDGDPTSDNPKDWPIITREALNKYLLRYSYVRVRRACKNNHALLSYDLLRRDLRDAIRAKYGNPSEKVKRYPFTESIEPDPKALDFFRNHRFDNGRTLPPETINEYYNNAIVLNAVHVTLNMRKANRNALTGFTSGTFKSVSNDVNAVDKKQYPHTLPSNHRRLSEKYRRYMKEGYISLIHSSFCNSNTQKIPDAGKMWLLARWANQVDRVANEKQLLTEYNQKATLEGWKKVQSVGTIINYLHREDIRGLWYGYRYGELKSKEKFAMQLSTIMPTMRDSIWYSDGTKLNYYYQTEDGKVETCTVYEVMDVYSEKLLGYHISKSEDYEAQYNAYKMAFKTSGHKPYQISYDNQGGHKKLEAGQFLTKLAHIAIRTMPYNGKSKTIESAFGRFQQQVLKKDWFFTGQNITAKKEESRANLEFIMANKANLPSLEEVKARYKQRREEWDQMPHHASNLPKNQMYFASENPKTTKVEMWDMVDLFWITRKEPVTCTAYGISFKEKNIKYDYLVYSSPMKPDQEWLRRNIDRKFFVKFDPQDMSLIYLYEMDEKGLRFVTQAETKITVHRGKQEQLEGEAALIMQVIDENKRLMIKDRDRMQEILKQHKQNAEHYGLETPIIKGIENRKSHKRQKKEFSYAEVEKEISNTTPLDENETTDYFKLY